jgi:ABC-type amino acid transport substrate-binding protein
MRKITYIISILILFIIVGCKEIEQDNKIIFGNRIFPPFTYLDEDKNFIGFSVDIAKEISFKLEKTRISSYEYGANFWRFE